VSINPASQKIKNPKLSIDIPVTMANLLPHFCINLSKKSDPITAETEKTPSSKPIPDSLIPFLWNSRGENGAMMD